jgi:hypothetical protein
VDPLSRTARWELADLVQVPHTDIVVRTRGGDEHPTIGGEEHLRNYRTTTVQADDRRAGLDPPDADHPIGASRDQQVAIRGEADGVGPAGMPRELEP